jgi:hypothetical protein
VVVAPDTALPYTGPRVTLDERGLIRISRSAGMPPLTVSPVPDLLRLHECLQDIPGEEERRDRGRSWKMGWTLREMVHRLCPDLHPRVRNVDPGSYQMVVSLELPVGQGSALRTVGEYQVEIDVDETLPSFGFSLASSGWARRYLVTPDGAVHVNTKYRPATPSDPAPMPCERVITERC